LLCGQDAVQYRRDFGYTALFPFMPESSFALTTHRGFLLDIITPLSSEVNGF
jgi:hypothetical protein